jgi:gamma-glutamylcyclotransferase
MYYFAYASNLNRKQMSERCPDSQPRFKATLPNYKLIFTGWSRKWRGGKASIKPFQGEKVVGAVYEISERCLRILDRHEEYPTVYNRMNVLVITENGEAIRAVTYIMRVQSEETQPSREYLAVIQQGYRDWEIT